jgi:hypothetical protein
VRRSFLRLLASNPWTTALGSAREAARSCQDSCYVLDKRRSIAYNSRQLSAGPTALPPTALPPTALPPKANAFLETIITLLLPYFATGTADMQAVRAEIIETLASYATRSRAEMLYAAQIIALGMTTLDVLAEAKTADMSQSMRIRSRGCANGLNRAAIRTEKALDQRLAGEPPPTPEPGALEMPRNQPARAPTNHRIHTQALPATAVPLQPNSQLWAGAMMDTLRQMGLPAQPAPHG